MSESPEQAAERVRRAEEVSTRFRRTGGSAFPVLINGINSEMPGMTLRDYFAAKALASGHRFGGLPADETPLQDWIARQCYEMADAMLKERAK